MNLSKIKDYFKNTFNWNDTISIGKIDNNQEKAICFYPSQREIAKIQTVGGKKNNTYTIISATILLRYTKNQASANEMAQKIYDFFNERSFFIDEKRVFTIMYSNSPIWLGTDDKNVYEYSLEIDFYKER